MFSDLSVPLTRPTSSGNSLTQQIVWPEGKRFAFSAFDDTDDATIQNVGPVYSFLSDCGFRTTKSVWVVAGDPSRGKHVGQTCDDADYLRWLLELQERGFEIAWHNSTWHSPRQNMRTSSRRTSRC